jgi:hypothetical protein
LKAIVCPPGDVALVLGGCTMTWVAVMVVLSVVPSTRTGTPVVTALAEAALVPISYVVVDASLMVTFSPAEVVSVKPVADTLLTVPDDPPAAGPLLALDPEPPPPKPPAPGAPDADPPAGLLLLAVATGELPPEVAATIP